MLKEITAQHLSRHQEDIGFSKAVCWPCYVHLSTGQCDAIRKIRKQTGNCVIKRVKHDIPIFVDASMGVNTQQGGIPLSSSYGGHMIFSMMIFRNLFLTSEGFYEVLF
ncbi:hypothetical protein GOP47_0009564 [Adiantum capillus-veneris]|uniref:Uncharacterized protein n=1 Tax=Adiantum capillus-veneris TaxID=13818 RepID=A0A9D4ZHA2_ADICA|nr:hypothetical protein GOP47_0009564 [Adiantum capillus-veneris]